MEFAEAEKHVKECFAGQSVGGGDESERVRKKLEEVWGNEVVEVVKRRQEEVRREREWVM